MFIYVVPTMTKLEDIYDPLSRARNTTTQIIYYMYLIQDNFITKLIKKHAFEFDERFHQLH